jgi:hypothetical protein
MSESKSAENIEQVKRGINNFLGSNVERAKRMKHPHEGFPHVPRKE